MDSSFSDLLTHTLFAHQIEGAKELLKNKEGFGIFAEQGTGKTLTCIAALNYLAAEARIGNGVFKVLIVCPNSLKYVWAREFEKSRVKWAIQVLDGHSKLRMQVLSRMPGGLQIVITNYDSLPKLLTAINEWAPFLIIADEVTAIKNHRAKRSKALKLIQAKTAWKWALTGTPMINNPLDVWSIFDWVKPGYFSPNFYAFRNFYANVYTGAGFPMIKGYKNLSQLSTKVKALSWRVTKEECLDLPEKVWSVREFDLSPEVRKAYDAMAKEMIAEIGDQAVPAPTILVKLLRLQQLTSGFIGYEDRVIDVGTSKLQVLEDMLDELDGQKVVVWTHFKHEIKLIVALCAKMKRPCVTFQGEDSASERERKIAEFQSTTKPMVFVANMAVGGYGITLTAASHCVYYSNTWSLGDKLQSQDRLHRLGQKNRVSYYELIARDTIDEYLVKKLRDKGNLLASVTGADVERMVYGK